MLCAALEVRLSASDGDGATLQDVTFLDAGDDGSIGSGFVTDGCSFGGDLD